MRCPKHKLLAEVTFNSDVILFFSEENIEIKNKTIN
jgi:hypothetical protein